VEAFLQEWCSRPLELDFLTPRLPEGYASWEEWERYGELFLPWPVLEAPPPQLLLTHEKGL